MPSPVSELAATPAFASDPGATCPVLQAEPVTCLHRIGVERERDLGLGVRMLKWDWAGEDRRTKSVLLYPNKACSAEDALVVLHVDVSTGSEGSHVGCEILVQQAHPDRGGDWVIQDNGRLKKLREVLSVPAHWRRQKKQSKKTLTRSEGSSVSCLLGLTVVGRRVGFGVGVFEGYSGGE